MGEIVIKNLNDLQVRVEKSGITLLTALQNNYIDWMHACGGKGRCKTCKCRVLEGMDHLSQYTLSEERFLN